MTSQTTWLLASGKRLSRVVKFVSNENLTSYTPTPDRPSVIILIRMSTLTQICQSSSLAMFWIAFFILKYGNAFLKFRKPKAKLWNETSDQSCYVLLVQFIHWRHLFLLFLLTIWHCELKWSWSFSNGHVSRARVTGTRISSTAAIQWNFQGTVPTTGEEAVHIMSCFDFPTH